MARMLSYLAAVSIGVGAEPTAAGVEAANAPEIDSLREWIARRAAKPDEAAPPRVRSGHWSLQPLRLPAVPAGDRSFPASVAGSAGAAPASERSGADSSDAIDAFIGQRLAKEGLSLAPEADRPTLIRRLSFDLLGLPPSPREVDDFVRDPSPNAYRNLVDRLLASPRYGERWGRHWLDVARFTESQGFEYDRLRDNAWPYRDYVIRSFNDDKPYDRFMKEQVAGDVLEPVTSDGIVGASLLVCGPWDQAGNSQSNATQKAITREEEMEDLVSVIGQSFLGLTINCARCHAHKFDPIPQEEYYRIKSVFDGVKHGERPLAPPAESAESDEGLAELKRGMAEAEAEIARIDAGGVRAGSAGLTPEQRAARDAVSARLKGLKEAADALKPPAALAYAGTREQPAPTRRLRRGDVKSPDEVVTPGALSAIVDLDPEFGLAADGPEAQRRLKFAEWLADARHPLPARVMANRVWHYHFGLGLVATPNDFGASGARPSHPELLDWLAVKFIESGWRVKSLHRLIVNSATYRQASGFNARAAALDADNQLLWRFSPHRLEAEAVRDAMLAVSGQLNLQIGGPSFRPFDALAFPANAYAVADKIGPEFNRRTVYRMNVNSGKEPLLDAFDCPDPSVKSPRRGVTTTPLQALGLMNNSFVQRQAAHLAERAAAESNGDGVAALQACYRFALGRRATPEEAVRAADAARDRGLASVCWALLNSTEFIYVR